VRDLSAKPKPNNTEVRPNVESWPNQTELKPSAEYSADVPSKPNFGAPLADSDTVRVRPISGSIEKDSNHNTARTSNILCMKSTDS